MAVKVDGDGVEGLARTPELEDETERFDLLGVHDELAAQAREAERSVADAGSRCARGVFFIVRV